MPGNESGFFLPSQNRWMRKRSLLLRQHINPSPMKIILKIRALAQRLDQMQFDLQWKDYARLKAAVSMCIYTNTAVSRYLVVLTAMDYPESWKVYRILQEAKQLES